MMEVIGMEVHGLPEILFCIAACAVSLALSLYPVPALYQTMVHDEPIKTLQTYPLCVSLIAWLMWALYGPIVALTGVRKFQTFCLCLLGIFAVVMHVLYMYVCGVKATDSQLDTMRQTLSVQLLVVLVPIFIYRDAYRVTSVVWGVLMYASTIPSIVDAYRRQDTSYLPWGLCSVHFLNAIAWFAYAVYTPTFESYLVIANGSGITLGIVQLLVLYILVAKFQTKGVLEDFPVASLTSFMTAIHNVCVRNWLPTTNRTQVSREHACILFRLLKGWPINWADHIMRKMVRMKTMKKTAVLGYPSLLCAYVKKCGFKPKKEDQFKENTHVVPSSSTAPPPQASVSDVDTTAQDV